MKAAVAIGSRPEIIKMSPVIRALERAHLDHFILHTNQHYSRDLDSIFFLELGLPKPNCNLNTGSGSHAETTANVLVRTERVLAQEKPDIVLVQGDTNSAFAVALAATKMQIKVGHVEAGLRSNNRRMPEEVNRVLIDHIADYLFAPADGAKSILINEGVEAEKIFVTGNTVVDALYQNLDIARERSKACLKKLHLHPNEYFLTTVHREENADDAKRLKSIILGIRLVADKYGCPIVFPAHPRTTARIADFGFGDLLESVTGLRIIDPVGYFDFLMLEANALLAMTDSGGVQEETCILKVPCVTLRDETERPETLDIGSNTVAGTSPTSILEAVDVMMSRGRDWANPFGDGDAGTKIARILCSEMG